MKKNIALLFILSANLIFLAHVLVPHHHHNNEVFVVNDECESQCHSEEHAAAEHNHEQEENGNTDYCSLNKVFVVTQEQINKDLELLKTTNIDLLSNICLAVLFADFSITPFLNKNLYRNPPLLQNKYIHFASSCKGLRAPPIV